MNVQRFKKLYRLAHGGDVVSKADLWLEFGFAYDHDPLPVFMQEPLIVAGVADPGSGGTPPSVTNPSAPSLCPFVLSRGQQNPSAPSSDLSRLSSNSSVFSVVKNKISSPERELPCE